MRSAQRRAKVEKRKSGNGKIKILLKIIIPVFVVVGFFLYLKLTTKYWDGHNKVSFVFQKPSGDVGVTILDPLLSEETTLIIPGNTQLNVARNYGTFRIKNVWQLGINEKLNGTVLAQTITNNFLFPTFLWSDRDLTDPFRFVLSPKITNISLGDRLAMAAFALKVKSIDKTEIDLGKNQFLKKQILVDGEPGYITNGQVSGRLTVYFSDNSFLDKNLKFGLIDETQMPGVSNTVGSILEVIGGKVVSVDKRPANPGLDCLIYGKSGEAVNKIATLFNCKKSAIESDFDMVIDMGAKFPMLH